MSGALDDGTRTWRGWSGRPYAARAIELRGAALDDRRGLVAVAVKLSRRGVPQAVSVASFSVGAAKSDRAAWVAHARRKGATEARIISTEGQDAAAIHADLRGMG